MSAGCTDCGRKGGCDHRKGAMFAAIDAALARLYPTRRWDERDAAAEEGVPREVAGRLEPRLVEELRTSVIARPGSPDELCDYLYVLCFGRAPSLLPLAFGDASPGLLSGIMGDAPGPRPHIEELHLRVALSSVAPCAGVQEVRLRARGDAGTLLVEEEIRSGVFDPVLLPRFQRVVAVLTELGIRHLDFGELTTPPAGYVGGSFAEAHGTVLGAEPCTANFLFFPHPCSSITSSVFEIPAAPAGPGVAGTL
jgi:hypothetical protein